MEDLKVIREIFAQVPKERKVGLVKDGPVYYIVLNSKKNEINDVFLKELEEAVETIEKSPLEEAVLVTIGSGPKIFSNGFDLHWWMDDI